MKKTLLALLLVLTFAINISAQYDHSYIEITPSWTSGEWDGEKIQTNISFYMAFNIAMNYLSIKPFYNTQIYNFGVNTNYEGKISIQQYGIGFRYYFSDGHKTR